MKIVGYVLRRPYTVVAVLIMICLLAVGAASRMPIDIFPEINIPVVSVVWTYNGMSAPDIQNRILSLNERSIASLCRRYFAHRSHQLPGCGRGEDLSARRGGCEPGGVAVGEQRAGRAEIYAAQHTPPLVLRYDATDVPIIQLSLDTSLPDTRLNDLGRTSSGRISPSCMGPKCPSLTAANPA